MASPTEVRDLLKYVADNKHTFDPVAYQRIVEHICQTPVLPAGGAPVQYRDPMNQQLTPVGMIGMRMRWPKNGDRAPFDFIEAFQAAPDKYFVFIVHKEQAVTIEDNELFPSDTLITQLRLILKE